MTDTTNDLNLSRALSGLHLVGANWATIDLGPTSGFSLDADSAVFAVHFVLDGEVLISSAHGEPQPVGAGASVILPNGAPHVIRTGPNARLRRMSHIRQDDRREQSPFAGEDSPAHISIGVDRPSDAVATVLSGQMALTWPQDLLPPRELLPGMIDGMPGYHRGSQSAQETVTSLREMTDAPGGTICLARFAHLLVTRRLREQLLKEPALVSDNPRSSVAIARVIQSIRLEPGFNWSVTNLARLAGMSRSGFADKFRVETGRTPMEVVTEARMEMAVRLLRRSREPIKAISASTGYGSSTSFIRSFRRQYGRAPTEFRNEQAAS